MLPEVEIMAARVPRSVVDGASVGKRKNAVSEILLAQWMLIKIEIFRGL